MLKSYVVVLFIVAVVLCACQSEKHKFLYTSAEESGFSKVKLDSLAAHLESSGSSSMILLVDGNIAFEWGNTKHKHLIHSMRKCLLNSLYGIAVEQGRIDTSAMLADLGIDDISPLCELEKTARIADLLKSRSGIFHNAAAVSEGMLRGMPKRGEYKPNEKYFYNNWDFNTVGAILEQETGRDIYTMFLEEIAKPLGMHHYKGEYSIIDGEQIGVRVPNNDGFYQYEKSKSQFPAYHFRMSSRDLALYGQLWLNGGKWNGKQIISKDWIEASTKAYSIKNKNIGMGYGMLWNVMICGEERKTTSFNHTGVGVHMLAVYPDANMVLVHRVDTENGVEYNKSDFYKMISLVFAARN